jgi:putative acetyltransferase
MIIRSEMPEDMDVIAKITSAAFAGKPYADGTEHLIINRLRNAQALVLSLVAENQGRVIGHVAFSAVTVNGENRGWYGLGPISVLPEYQKQGIGSSLIREGLTQLREGGARGCVLEGDPNYYKRFGFKNHPNLTYAGAPAPEYFMALSFYDDIPSGRVEFHPAFTTSP